MTILSNPKSDILNFILITIITLTTLSYKTVFSAIKQKNAVTFIVYQGTLEDTPENTMAAFKNAVELGANGLMVDVRITKDKRIILMHDETIDRTTDGKGRVDQLLYDELQHYDAGSWRSPEFKWEKVPLLSEVLRFCKANNLKLVLDVKQFGIEKQVIAIVKEQGMIEHTYFWGMLKDIRHLEPGLPIINIVFIETDEITRDTLDFAHTAKNHIAVKMINSDDRELLTKNISKKPDIIVLNYPQLVMDILHKDEPNKVVSLDSAEYIESQKTKNGVINAKDTAIPKQSKVNTWENTIYIRDELSTLVEIVKSKNSEKDDARMAALAITGLLNDDITSVLTDLLKHKKTFVRADAPVRANAAWALGLTLDRNALKPLINSLKENKEDVKREVILAIKRIANANQLNPDESEQISEKLVKILRDDPFANVRYDAARTLGDLNEKSSVNQLINSLSNDPDWNVKSACAGALGQIRDKRGIKPLKNILVNDANIDAAWARRRAAWALADIGEDAIAGLIEALGDNEKSVRQKASWALIKIGRPSVPSLVSSLKNIDKVIKEKAAWTLGWIRDDYATKALKWALKENDYDIKIAAAWALGRIGNTDALELLQTYRKERNFAVRRIVKEAIKRINNKTK
ncbi:MAG: HEAT repeat domain-containing protein [Candidatus Anammoxibacter sp.]